MKLIVHDLIMWNRDTFATIDFLKVHIILVGKGHTQFYMTKVHIKLYMPAKNENWVIQWNGYLHYILNFSNTKKKKYLQSLVG